jgi:hypothetical protein
MAIFRCQVNYLLGLTGKWSNVWHIQAAEMADAAAAPVIGMEDHLLAILDPTAVIKSYLLSEVGTDAFFTNDRNSAGTNPDVGSLLPLFNSVKVLFPSSDFGRPDLKYFKGSLGENNSGGGEVDSAFRTLVDAEIEAMIDEMNTNSTPLCSINGDVYESAQVQPAIQMRQMHRKRRKTAPPA